MSTGKRQVARTRVAKTGIVAGFNKGHVTTPRPVKVSRKARMSLPKKKLRAVKAVISELCGHSPMEKRVIEMLRVGKEKRALKFCNKRLGDITAAKKKRSKMEDDLRNAMTHTHHKK